MEAAAMQDSDWGESLTVPELLAFLLLSFVSSHV